MTAIWAHCPYCDMPYPTAGTLAEHIGVRHPTGYREAERLEPGAEAARRDDLARDVAQAWSVARRDRTVREVLPTPVRAAFDRLAETYGYGG